MNKDYKNMSIKQLEQELMDIEEKIRFQRDKLQSSNKDDQKSAKRRLERLYSKRQYISDIRSKKARKKYRIDKTVNYYGMTPTKMVGETLKHVAIIGGVAVTIYGTMWGVYQLHLNGVDNAQDLVSKITATESKQDYNNSNYDEQDSQKLKQFFSTKEGKLIEKYSLIYGVDKSLAASTYINGSPVKFGTYISVYNEQTNKYDDIIVSGEDSESQTKAVCAKLAEASQLCNANPVSMVAMYELNYDEMIAFVDKGLSVTDYQETLKDSTINNEFVQKVLADCSSVLNNSWYENGHLYSRTINQSTGLEQTTDEIVDDLEAYKTK